MARSTQAGPPNSAEQLAGAVRQALARVAGAYSMLFLSPKAMVGVRDPIGFRPLVLGR